MSNAIRATASRQCLKGIFPSDTDRRLPWNRMLEAQDSSCLKPLAIHNNLPRLYSLDLPLKIKSAQRVRPAAIFRSFLRPAPCASSIAPAGSQPPGRAPSSARSIKTGRGALRPFTCGNQPNALLRQTRVQQRGMCSGQPATRRTGRRLGPPSVPQLRKTPPHYRLRARRFAHTAIILPAQHPRCSLAPPAHPSAAVRTPRAYTVHTIIPPRTPIAIVKARFGQTHCPSIGAHAFKTSRRFFILPGTNLINYASSHWQTRVSSKSRDSDRFSSARETLGRTISGELLPPTHRVPARQRAPPMMGTKALPGCSLSLARQMPCRWPLSSRARCPYSLYTRKAPLRE